MLEAYFVRTATINRLRSGPLDSDLDDLATSLHQQGYASDSIRGYLRSCDQFAHWVVQQGYTIADANPTLVKRYISRLPRRPSGRLPKKSEGLAHLLKLWHLQKRLPAHSDEAPRTEIDQWLLCYDEYLVQVCSAAASTRRHYLRFARRFLTACFGAGRVDWSSYASPAGRRLCATRGGDQTRSWAKTSKYCRQIAPPIPRPQWGAGAGLPPVPFAEPG